MKKNKIVSIYLLSAGVICTAQVGFHARLQRRPLDTITTLGCRLHFQQKQEVKIRQGYELIKEVKVSPGAEVAAGDLIATAATSELSSTFVELESKQSGLHTEVNKSEEEIARLTREQTRHQRDFEAGTLSAHQLAVTQLALDSATIRLAKQRLEATSFASNVANEKKKFLQAEYRAEIAGTLFDLRVQVPETGRTIGLDANAVLAQIASVGRYELHCPLMDFQVRSLTLGSPGSFTLIGDEHEQGCELTTIAASLPKQESGGREASRILQYEVHCRFEDPGRFYPEGLTAILRFPRDTSEPLPSLPWEAVSFENNQAMVQVLGDDAPRGSPRKVTLGRRGQWAVEIIDGLSNAETVVIPPPRAY